MRNNGPCGFKTMLFLSVSGYDDTACHGIFMLCRVDGHILKQYVAMLHTKRSVVLSIYLEKKKIYLYIICIGNIVES